MQVVDRRFLLQLQGPLQGSSGASAAMWIVSALRGLPCMRQCRHWAWIRFLAHYRPRSRYLPAVPAPDRRVGGGSTANDWRHWAHPEVLAGSIAAAAG